MRRPQPVDPEKAPDLLRQWFLDAPGGEYLPAGFMEHEPTTVVVTGADEERWFWRLFTAAYQPVENDEDDEHESTYVVPKIVAEALVWYGGNDDWYAEIMEG